MVEVVRLYRTNHDSLKAFVDISVNGVLIKNIRVFKDRDGNISVALPKQQGKNGKWYPLVSFLNNEVKEELQETVLEAFYV